MTEELVPCVLIEKAIDLFNGEVFNHKRKEFVEDDHIVEGAVGLVGFDAVNFS